MTDYPRSIAAVNQVEPAPRRVRAMLGGRVVLDTTRALYLWEWPNYPQYYIPVDALKPDVLVDEGHAQRTRVGTAQRRARCTPGSTRRPPAAAPRAA